MKQSPGQTLLCAFDEANLQIQRSLLRFRGDIQRICMVRLVRSDWWIGLNKSELITYLEPFA